MEVPQHSLLLYSKSITIFQLFSASNMLAHTQGASVQLENALFGANSGKKLFKESISKNLNN